MTPAPDAQAAFPDVAALVIGGVAAAVIYVIKVIGGTDFTVAGLATHAIVGMGVFIVIARLRSRFGKAANAL